MYENTMTVIEARKAVKAAKTVLACIRVTPDDTGNFEISKALAYRIIDFAEGRPVSAFVQDDTMFFGTL